MPTYAIGDIQGCWSTLERLLSRISFRRSRDRLWLVGDLVNRGPDSLRVLRWAKKNDACVTTVLGNHDLHLLARAAGVVGAKPDDTLDQVLNASGRKGLVRWLRRRPLTHRQGPYLMVHAGLLPRWSPKRARALAKEVEAELRGDEWPDFLARSYARRPGPWLGKEMSDGERKLATLAIMTRIRVVDRDGQMDSHFKGPPEAAPKGLKPWFRAKGRRSADKTIVFGHWAALGVHVSEGVIAVDSGCVWGRALTAVRLEDRAVFSVPALL